MMWLGNLVLAPFRLLRGFVVLCLRLMGLDGEMIPMDGPGYEEYVVQHLKKRGFHNVEHTGAAGDFGVDIVATRHGVRYAIQCKYYTRNVPGDAVQQVAAGMTMYDCDRAVVVTNSRLTEGAKKLAKGNGVLVVEGLRPDQRSMTAEWVLTIALWLLLTILLLPKVRVGSATGYDVYILTGIGLFIGLRLLVGALSWFWRLLTQRKNS